MTGTHLGLLSVKVESINPVLLSFTDFTIHEYLIVMKQVKDNSGLLCSKVKCDV